VLLPLGGTTRGILLVLSLGLPASALNARWVLQGERRFGRTAAIEVAISGSQLVAVLALVNGADDAPEAAVALTLAAWIATVLSLVLAGPSARGWPAIGRIALALIARSLPLGAAAVAITIYYSVDTVLLGLFRGADEVAYYAAAYRILLPVISLAGVVGTVAIPRLSLLVASDVAAGEGEVVDLARPMILLGLPVAVGGALAAEPIIRLVYGPDFLPAVDAFRILVWSIATVYCNAAFAFLLLARGGDGRYLAAVSTGAVANICLNVIVIPVAGMIGAAVVTMVSEVTVLALLLWWTRDVARPALPGALARAALPTVVMAAVIWPVHDSLAAIPLGAVAFAIVATVTGAIPARSLLARMSGGLPS
jgi:O-antigen/teichoic acid export membrane protein